MNVCLMIYANLQGCEILAATQKKKRFPLALICFISVVLAVCITITVAPNTEIGRYIPSWQQIFEITGLRERTNATRPSVHFIDVGQGDAVLFRSGTYSALIDAGTNSDDGQRVVDYLNAAGVTRLDAAIATHAHEDHIGGMDRVLDSFKVGTFIMSQKPPDGSVDRRMFDSVLHVAERRGVLITPPVAGKSFTIGDFTLTLLYFNDDDKNENNRSVVVRAECFGKSFLFMGDAEKETEAALIEAGLAQPYDVLKLGHHGSDTSTTEAFLAAVQPQYAVACCGRSNQFGHPSVKVCERLSARSVSFLRTDIMGTVKIFVDKDEGLVIEKEKGGGQ